MKYWKRTVECNASEDRKFIEFQPYGKELRNPESLCLAEEILVDSGFRELWVECMRDDLVFDMDTISEVEWKNLLHRAMETGGEVLEVLRELEPWMEAQFSAGCAYISVERLGEEQRY